MEVCPQRAHALEGGRGIRQSIQFLSPSREPHNLVPLLSVFTMNSGLNLIEAIGVAFGDRTEDP